jgi:hypothetical protein
MAELFIFSNVLGAWGRLTEPRSFWGWFFNIDKLGTNCPMLRLKTVREDHKKTVN